MTLKKHLAFVVIAAVLSMVFMLFVACGNSEENYIDLTTMNATLAYSQVYNMTCNPSQYEGKTVKVSGECYAYTSSANGKRYFSIIVSDTTACCSQSVGFVLKDKNYPNEGEFITVEGLFGTYQDGGTVYCRLTNAQLISGNIE